MLTSYSDFLMYNCTSIVLLKEPTKHWLFSMETKHDVQVNFFIESNVFLDENTTIHPAVRIPKGGWTAVAVEAWPPHRTIGSRIEVEPVRSCGPLSLSGPRGGWREYVVGFNGQWASLPCESHGDLVSYINFLWSKQKLTVVSSPRVDQDIVEFTQDRG